MKIRGKIYNRAWAQQIRDFSKMKWGSVTPTDIDAMVEYRESVYLFFEFKYCKGEYRHLNSGQFRALESVCDALYNAGKFAALVVCTHDLEPEHDIDVSEMPVVEMYQNGKYITPKENYTAKEILWWCLKGHDKGTLEMPERKP